MSRCGCEITLSSNAREVICPARYPSASRRRRSGGFVEVPTLNGDVVSEDSERDPVRPRVPRTAVKRASAGARAGRPAICSAVVVCGDSRVSLGAEQKGVAEKLRGLAAAGQPSAARAILLRGREEVLYRRGRLRAREPCSALVSFRHYGAHGPGGVPAAARGDARPFHLERAIGFGEQCPAGAGRGGRRSGPSGGADHRGFAPRGFEAQRSRGRFSSSGIGVPAHAQACAAAGVPVLIGATGYDAAGRLVLEQAAKSIPVLLAPNTSVGVAVMTELVSLAAARLGSSYDVEIFEAHHRMKRDAPSGTALALGEAVARARAVSLNEVAAFDRSALNAPRAPGSIGFSSLRAGDIVGEHTVTFAAAGERLEITHRATDRMTFGRGALRAAEWLVGRPAGLQCTACATFSDWSNKHGQLIAPGIVNTPRPETDHSELTQEAEEDVLKRAPPPALRICANALRRKARNRSVDTCSASSRRWHRVPWRLSRRKRQHDR